MAGVGPEDIHVAQLQDTESGAEIMHMAENGFCADGEQEQWIAEGRTRIGGQLPVNTDGGCLACGEPIGASGLRQVYENFVQLTGQAGARQVPGDPRLATAMFMAPRASRRSRSWNAERWISIFLPTSCVSAMRFAPFSTRRSPLSCGAARR